MPIPEELFQTAMNEQIEECAGAREIRRMAEKAGNQKLAKFAFDRETVLLNVAFAMQERWTGRKWMESASGEIELSN